MDALIAHIASNPVFYISRDIERCIGFGVDTAGYAIISNETTFGKTVRARHPGNIHLIREDRLLDTWELLEHHGALSRISHSLSPHKPNIIVFKNTPRIEKICKKHDWNLLNPSADLANTIEEKISQVAWLGDLEQLLPPHRIAVCKDILWDGNACVLQWNRAHTGMGTILISSEKQLKKIQKIFPDRPTRISIYVNGPTFTNNNIIAGGEILVGPMNYQITGIAPFTDNRFATIGNDWALPSRALSQEQIRAYRALATAVGEKMRQSGWQGLFGIDAVLDEKTGTFFLIEINARQPASASFESILQERLKKRKQDITTFEAHIAALCGVDVKGYSLVHVTDGAQVIVRNHERQRINRTVMEEKQRILEENGYTAISYDNTAAASELLRIQSQTGIMKKHGEFNEIGEHIVQSIAS